MGNNSTIVVIDDVVLVSFTCLYENRISFCLNILMGGGVTEEETIGFVIENKYYSPRWKQEPLPDFMKNYNIFFLPKIC